MDISDKVTMLEPEEAPLYSLLKKRKKAGLKLVRDMECVWLDDELQPFVSIVDELAPPRRRICPSFILCKNPTCDFARPRDTQIRSVRCYNICANGGEAIELLEVNK